MKAKKTFGIVLSALILASLLTACNNAKPADTPPAPTVKTTESAQHEFKSGGVDFCEKLEIGNTYYYDFDKDGLYDVLVYNNDMQAEPFKGQPYIKVTFGTYPDDSAIWHVPTSSNEECEVFVVDSDPNDDGLEIIETDNGASADPTSRILTKSYSGNFFDMIYGPGVIINAENPFKSEEGFCVCTETWLWGSNTLSGKMRIVHSFSPAELELVDNAYKFDSAAEYAIEHELTVKVVNADSTLGQEITLPVGEKIRAYETDMESYITFMLSDGSIVWADIQLGESSVNWIIGGVDQNVLYSDFVYEG